MSSLQIAWAAGLLVTLTALPVGVVRIVALRSGEVGHRHELVPAARVAVTLGLAGLLTLVVCTVLLAT